MPIRAAYYNEIDPLAAAWLRELIKTGNIADGVVDERSIEDVTPNDIKGFHQCHFFAGIGVWSYALRRAGWPDDRPVWTGSCPCQPFSSAGKGNGFDDERHLWPAWHWLIEQCRPPVVFGEQVASKDAEPWLDLVQADLEALAYSVGAVPFPSAGVGAPHIRDRLYWAAEHPNRCVHCGRADDRRWNEAANHWLCDHCLGRNWVAKSAHERHERAGLARGRRDGPADLSATGLVADAASARHTETREHERGRPQLSARPAEHGGVVRPAGPVNGLWRDADWLFCRDGKWRPVEPGTFPLAHGAPARVGRLRGYGNAINAEAAVAWIESCLDVD